MAYDPNFDPRGGYDPNAGFSGFLGLNNTFQSRAALNDFQAQQAQLAESDYEQSIADAQRTAFGAQAQADATRGRQNTFADYLFDQMNGQGPSLAQAQLQSATDQMAKQSAGAVASMRGLDPSLAARQILNQTAQLRQQAAGQSAQTRLQEQLSTQGILGSHLAAQRSQDIGQQGANTQLAAAMAGAQNQQNQARIQNSMQSQQLQQNADLANQRAQMEAQAQNAGVAAANAQADAERKEALARAAGAAIATTIPGAGGVAAKAAMGIPGKAMGGAIPGRARFPGDHPGNDTVLARLSPGEVVVPRSIAQAPDAPKKTRDFIEHLREQGKLKPAKAPADPMPSYGALLVRMRAMEQQMKGLQSQARKMIPGGK